MSMDAFNDGRYKQGYVGLYLVHKAKLDDPVYLTMAMFSDTERLGAFAKVKGLSNRALYDLKNEYLEAPYKGSFMANINKTLGNAIKRAVRGKK